MVHEFKARVGKYTAHVGMIDPREILLVEVDLPLQPSLERVLGRSLRARVEVVGNEGLILRPDLQASAFSLKSRPSGMPRLQLRLEGAEELEAVEPAFGLTQVTAACDLRGIWVPFPFIDKRQPPRRINRRGQVKKAELPPRIGVKTSGSFVPATVSTAREDRSDTLASPPPVEATIHRPATGEVVMTFNGATFSGEAPTTIIAAFIAQFNLKA